MGAFHAAAIVFDLDGVLVDTMPSIRATWTRWATERGLLPAEVLASIHMTGLELVRRFAPDVDPHAEVRRISAGQARTETALARFDGALELLEKLPAERWAIVTSARLPIDHLPLALGWTPQRSSEYNGSSGQKATAGTAASICPASTSTCPSGNRVTAPTSLARQAMATEE